MAEDREEYGLSKPSSGIRILSKKHLFWIIPLLVVIWFLSRGHFGSVNIDTVNVWIGGITFFFVFAYAFDTELKIKTPKFIANDFHTTTDGNYFTAGQYVIFTYPDYDYYIHTKGTSGAICVPRSSITFIGRNVASSVKLGRYNFDELPSEVRQVISERGISGTYLAGHWDPKTEINYNETSEVTNELKALRSHNSRLLALLKDHWKVIGQSVQQSSAVVDMARKETMRKKIKQAVTGRAEEEET